MAAVGPVLTLRIKSKRGDCEGTDWTIPTDINFRAVLDVMSQVLLNTTPLPTAFEYEDEDGDFITVYNDDELLALLTYCQWKLQYGLATAPVSIYPKAVKSRNPLKLEVDTVSPSLTFESMSYEGHISGLQRNADEEALINLLAGGQVSPQDLHFLEVLGRGRGGTVYRTFHSPTKVVMAVKVVPLDVTIDEQRQIMFELEILHKCDSKFIIGFYGAFFEENRISICTEYMDGGSLDNYAPIPEAVLSKVTAGMLNGLNYLRSMKVLHRDIKPSNTLVNSQGQVKLCDFGVSTQLMTSLTKTYIGTNAYMAPERILGGEYGVHSEVWSLGLTLMEVALARFPYLPDGSKIHIYLMPFDLLQCIVNEDPPTLPEENFSSNFLNFTSSCLKKIPELRPRIEDLLNHPFVQSFNSEAFISKWLIETMEQQRVMKKVPSTVSSMSSNSECIGLEQIPGSNGHKDH